MHRVSSSYRSRIDPQRGARTSSPHREIGESYALILRLSIIPASNLAGAARRNPSRFASSRFARDDAPSAHFPATKNRDPRWRSRAARERGKLVLTEFYAEPQRRSSHRWTSSAAVNEAHCTCRANAPRGTQRGRGGGGRGTHREESVIGRPTNRVTGREKTIIGVAARGQSA